MAVTYQQSPGALFDLILWDWIHDSAERQPAWNVKKKCLLSAYWGSSCSYGLRTSTHGETKEISGMRETKKRHVVFISYFVRRENLIGNRHICLTNVFICDDIMPFTQIRAEQVQKSGKEKGKAERERERDKGTEMTNIWPFHPPICLSGHGSKLKAESEDQVRSRRIFEKLSSRIGGQLWGHLPQQAARTSMIIVWCRLQQQGE